MTTINSKNIWPKNFYDDGNGSYGFIQPNKIQSGALTGATITGGSGSNVFTIGSGGITVDGLPVTGGGTTGPSYINYPIVIPDSISIPVSSAGDMFNINTASGNGIVFQHPMGPAPGLQAWFVTNRVGSGSNVLIPFDGSVPSITTIGSTWGGSTFFYGIGSPPYAGGPAMLPAHSYLTHSAAVEDNVFNMHFVRMDISCFTDGSSNNWVKLSTYLVSGGTGTIRHTLNTVSIIITLSNITSLNLQATNTLVVV